LIKEHAFEKLKAHRLWLEVLGGNYRAFNLYRTEGFVLEGFHRESFKQGDEYLTLRVMSMLANEYVRETRPRVRH
jgi:RimJ/RimL family protein N-acetyltransferase